MELLTPLQRKLLQEIGKSPLRDEFFLTGPLDYFIFTSFRNERTVLGGSSKLP
jgi:hypothetical protein